MRRRSACCASAAAASWRRRPPCQACARPGLALSRHAAWTRLRRACARHASATHSACLKAHRAHTPALSASFVAPSDTRDLRCVSSPDVCARYAARRAAAAPHHHLLRRAGRAAGRRHRAGRDYRVRLRALSCCAATRPDAAPAVAGFVRYCAAAAFDLHCVLTRASLRAGGGPGLGKTQLWCARSRRNTRSAPPDRGILMARAASSCASTCSCLRSLAAWPAKRFTSVRCQPAALRRA